MENTDHQDCVFNWLCLHHNDLRSANDWCSLLGITIIDNDGFFCGLDYKMDLASFMKGIFQCTISPR
jgi:hypothetical protein